MIVLNTTSDLIQSEMLLVLLKRLIIYITSLAKSEYIPSAKNQEERFHMIRIFNLLVEANFKIEHSVSFYVDRLYKPPKTLSNLFAIYNQSTPSQIIQKNVLIQTKFQYSVT
ncbi:hypothetical protein A9970_04420 [Sphingobacterium sp. UME9]|nr:hypothetical protein [Sphingobacterium sp. UME9]